MQKRVGFIKKALAVITSASLCLSLSACGDLEDWDEGEYDEEYLEDEEGGFFDDWDSEEGDHETDYDGGSNYDSNGAGSIGTISEDGSWTIFVYMCGTDLESFNSMGTGDFEEMLNADGSDDVKFVVQTGGTQSWNNDFVSADANQRFVVNYGDISKVDEQSISGMGKEETLTDFVSWGMANYKSDHNGLIFWDHGGGSISGVCMDELDNYDTLSLREIGNALGAASLSAKFDFIGFDACLMGTVETANILEPYALFMYGSEETEPGSGWDYSAIGSFLSQYPGADGAALGQVVCDSFLKACEEQNDDDLTTLSVVDLSKMSALVSAFDEFSGSLCAASGDEATRASIIRAIESSENFGGNNKSEGYTNMVDMAAILSNCSEYASGADTVKSALQDAVIYSVSGSNHKNAGGLAMYYPLSIQGSNELDIFGDISVCQSYSDFLSCKTEGYEGGGAVISGEETGESSVITFVNEPGINEEGIYGFKLDTNGINAAADVYAIVYELTPEGDALIELGETYDVAGDWDTGAFYDAFDGYWLSLPDGQNLATYIVEVTDDSIIYTSPILLNGNETNLRVKQSIDSGETSIEGAWDGIDEHGSAAREIIKLKDGDIIIPVYYAYALEGDDEYAYEGAEYTVSGDTSVLYGIMEDGDYLYSFNIDDIYGDYYLADPAVFNVNGEEISFYTE
ncbi:MAG: hypothetical protein K5669_04185 [Lachnospiraceae bacterium]|nr:hypothetical protein [Lachnospiraceae bacterium]